MTETSLVFPDSLAMACKDYAHMDVSFARCPAPLDGLLWLHPTHDMVPTPLGSSCSLNETDETDSQDHCGEGGNEVRILLNTSVLLWPFIQLKSHR